MPISYRAEYHYRSGSTKQVLRGAALDRFLLGKTGRRWDAAPVPGVKVGDLDDALWLASARLSRGGYAGAEVRGGRARLLVRVPFFGDVPGQPCIRRGAANEPEC